VAVEAMSACHSWANVDGRQALWRLQLPKPLIVVIRLDELRAIVSVFALQVGVDALTGSTSCVSG